MMWINLFQIPYQVPMLNPINFFNNFKVIIWQDIQCVHMPIHYTFLILPPTTLVHIISVNILSHSEKNLLNFFMGSFQFFHSFLIFSTFWDFGVFETQICQRSTNLWRQNLEEPDNQANSNALPCWVFFMDFISLWLFNFYSKLSNSKRNN